jgi:hypothetical protein
MTPVYNQWFPKIPGKENKEDAFFINDLTKQRISIWVTAASHANAQLGGVCHHM